MPKVLTPAWHLTEPCWVGSQGWRKWDRCLWDGCPPARFLAAVGLQWCPSIHASGLDRLARAACSTDTPPAGPGHSLPEGWPGGRVGQGLSLQHSQGAACPQSGF